VRGALPLFFVESTMPLALVDPDGRLIAVNSGLCTLVGRPAATLTGARFADLVHADDRLGHVASWGSLFGGVAHSDRVETRLRRPDGTVVPVTMYRHVVIDADNATAVGLAACHDERQVLDLTERASGVAELARTLVETMADAAAAAELVTRYLAEHLGDLAVVWQLSESDDTLDPVAGWHRDPRRRDAVAALLAAGPRSAQDGLLARVLGLGQALHLGPAEVDAHRAALHTSHGTYVDDYGVAALLLVPLRSRGRIVGVVGVSHDRGGNGYAPAAADLVSTVAALGGPVLHGARRLASLTSRERSARSILDAINVGTAVLDADGIVRNVNPAWMRAAQRGGPMRLPVGSDYVAACDAAAADGVAGSAELANAVRTVLAGSVTAYAADCAYRSTDGADAWCHVELTPLESGGCIVTQLDITERKRLEVRLAHEATHDALTGLPNRTLLTDRLELALARDRRGGLRTAVLFCDLDFFKTINDDHGHDAGDAVLRAVAKRFRHTVRASDTVARIGGDEFVVLIESVTNLDEVLVVAGKLVQSLVDEQVGLGLGLPGVSVGVALSEETSNADTLLRQADAAMYSAKQAGRSRVEVAAEGSEP
jgi:diguanylate cyclase (GGDEF)-like protein/PAS domain S-box-containing protein